MRLYGDFYCAGEARPSLVGTQQLSAVGPSPFVHALSEANSGSGSRDPGWTIVARESGRLVVERDRIRVWAAPQDVYPVDGGSLEPGAAAGVRMPKELLRLSPGFYMALGNAEFPLDGSDLLVRFYWNLRGEGSIELVRLLTAELNDAQLAFRLKVVSDPAAYNRCDAGVLYTLAREYEHVNEIVADTYRRTSHSLKPLTPAFTKSLAPGLGLAEDPTGGLGSFGLSRCLLVAEGIARAAELGLDSTADRLACLVEQFAEAGVALDTPYLNPGSEDRYSLAGRT
jgi:type III HopA1-like effector protein